ncbi:agamous-like MADS-box protein AGL29 [Prunus avium]|uniref:Agamous-like MADS-box protein AGL29 n=1 Tax=Prunus avium TaxID=42229 RepID=A0A6P5RB68_PRUAV|nr:agamous-like MADS-box protein AGL29 [Prunus avium]
MEGRKTKGSQKIEMKRIENQDDRLVTFSKRRSGVYKKASELATLCGAEVGAVVFSPSGKPFSYANSSIDSIANRFLNGHRHHHQHHDNINDDIMNIDALDRSRHTIVEAYRQVRIDEMNKKHNELVSKLEVERERGKALQKRMKAKAEEISSSAEAGGSTGSTGSSSSSGSKSQLQGWWEAPFEELDLIGLSFMTFQILGFHKWILHFEVSHFLNEFAFLGFAMNFCTLGFR